MFVVFYIFTLNPIQAILYIVLYIPSIIFGMNIKLHL
jgi:hypothetical protein